MIVIPGELGQGSYNECLERATERSEFDVHMQLPIFEVFLPFPEFQR